jgi:hypothetical protein
MCPCNLYIAYSYAKSMEKIRQLSNDIPEDYGKAISVRGGGKRLESKNIWRFFHKWIKSKHMNLRITTFEFEQESSGMGRIVRRGRAADAWNPGQET